MKKFLDLGPQPLANSYILKKNLEKKEKKFHLIVGFNPKNYLVSILNTVSKEKMFNKILMCHFKKCIVLLALLEEKGLELTSSVRNI